MLNKDFWKGKKVFITGHTGFKGSWLCLWLHSLGAEITGYSLPPPTNPSMYSLCEINNLCSSITGDIRDGTKLSLALLNSNPDIIIHSAAQPLVRKSYHDPLGTYETNVLGTVHLFEAVRKLTKTNKKNRVLINITSDKCYENKEWVWGYRENDPLGGHDPYSNSKACSELITSCYTNSYFSPESYSEHRIAIGSVRAGNVIGGGDWAADRLIPDSLRSLLKGEEIIIRNPKAIRPWQHVLEPLSGYLLLAEKMFEDGVTYPGSWNFGPNKDSEQTVEWIVEKLCEKWGSGSAYTISGANQLHEANFLKLDCSKARTLLNWKPKWDIEQALEKIIEWIRIYQQHGNLKEISLEQIKEYMILGN